MKKKHLIIIAILVSIIFIAISNYNYIFAYSDLTNNIWSGVASVHGAATIIISAVQWIGVVVLVGAAIAKGIKFVSSSPDGKAEIKKEIVMYLVGAIIVLAAGRIISTIFHLVLESNLY